MAELKRKEEELTTAELVSYGIPKSNPTDWETVTGQSSEVCTWSRLLPHSVPRLL